LIFDKKVIQTRISN